MVPFALSQDAVVEPYWSFHETLHLLEGKAQVLFNEVQMLFTICLKVVIDKTVRKGREGITVQRLR